MAKRISAQRLLACTTPRTFVKQSWKMDLLTDEKHDYRREVVTEACGTPTFQDNEERTGVCRNCHEGWEVEDNNFASAAEKERAAKAW